MVGKLYFTSDTHFGHKNIIKYEKRGPLGRMRLFDSVEEHDEYLIEQWNETVDPQDTVWHLGDLSFKKDITFVKRLNGHKHLVLGNHDLLPMDKYKEYFESVRHYKELKVPFVSYNPPNKDVLLLGDKVPPIHLVLMHFPLEIWNKRHYGAFHLHGHCHGHLIQKPHEPRYDVGVDVNMYAPVSLDTILRHFRNVKAAPDVKDHHT